MMSLIAITHKRTRRASGAKSMSLVDVVLLAPMDSPRPAVFSRWQIIANLLALRMRCIWAAITNGLSPCLEALKKSWSSTEANPSSEGPLTTLICTSSFNASARKR